MEGEGGSVPWSGGRQWETLFLRKAHSGKGHPLPAAGPMRRACFPSGSMLLLPHPRCLSEFIKVPPPPRPPALGKQGGQGSPEASRGEGTGRCWEDGERERLGVVRLQDLADTPHPLSQDGVQRGGWFLKIKRGPGLVSELPPPTLRCAELRPTLLAPGHAQQ